MISGPSFRILRWAPQALVVVFAVSSGAQDSFAQTTGTSREFQSVQKRLGQLGPEPLSRIKKRFQEVGLTYPPATATLVGLKAERRVLLYAGSSKKRLKFVDDYYIQGASGVTGPKLRQGDHQVPEGIYQLEALNPNSRFYLSLRVNYPNAYDRRMAARDRRRNLGGDIYLHGGVESVGCLALNNRDIEELFVLAADVGVHNVDVILSPADLRTNDPDINGDSQPAWTAQLYQQIRQALHDLPPPS